MLTQYLTQTRQLLQNPSAPTSLYSDADLTGWINTARGQVAGEGLCVPVPTTLAITAGNPGLYSFPTPASPFGPYIQIRTVWYVSGSGRIWVNPESWESYSLYEYNSATPPTGAPQKWVQYAQGENGSLLVYPVPDINYTLALDGFAVGIPLVNDSTTEAIPYPWTDAVPYFAAYLALMSAQVGVRLEQAQRLFQLYEMFMDRARKQSTRPVLPYQTEQTATPGGIKEMFRKGAG